MVASFETSLTLFKFQIVLVQEITNINRIEMFKNNETLLCEPEHTVVILREALSYINFLVLKALPIIKFLVFQIKKKHF